MTHFTQAIAQFTATVDAGVIAKDARRVLQLSLLNWMAVGVAGRDESVAKVVRQVAIEEGGRAKGRSNVEFGYR